MASATTEKKQSSKPKHLTNIRYPFAKTWDKTGNYVEFELANVHFSTSNAIRRIMISQIKTVGFRTEPYNASQVDIKVNDTPLHNQIVAHRIGMIPINIKKPESFNVDDYQFIIDVTNDTNAMMPVTSEHFQIKQISNNKMLSKDEVKKFFPPDPLTGGYSIISMLRPKYFVPSKEVMPEVVEEMSRTFTKKTEEPVKFHIEAKACVSNAAENARFSPVCCSCYINTVDPNRAAVGLKEYIDKQKQIAVINNTTSPSDEILSNRFNLTERARYFYVNDKNEPNVFTFKIETVGIIPPLVVYHRAIDILKEKINSLISNLISRNENNVKINVSNKISGGFEFIVKNEDETLGNIVQAHLCMLFSDILLPKERRLLDYVGFKKMHPLDEHIVFEIKGLDDNLDNLINNVIKPGCSEIVKQLNTIQHELESTPSFIAELKML